MRKTHIIVLSIATLLGGVLCSDDAVHKSFAVSSSSSFSSYSSSECDTTSEEISDCTGPHEYYENCDSDTDTEDDSCQTGCQCDDNYERDEEGNCLPVEDCTDPTATEATTVTTSTPTGIDPNEALEKIWGGNAIFTQKFLKLKTLENPNKSFIASPFSVLLPLGQLALFANGGSYDQLAKVLNIDSKNEIQKGFRQLLDNFKLPKNITLSLAQKIFGNVQFEFTDNFKHVTEVYFDAEAENLDFSQNIKAAKEINQWVNKQTNGLIPNLLEPGVLDALTRLVLVNAIYFKGNWFRPFNPKLTQKKDFLITQEKNSTVNMMYQKGRFRYGENPKLQIKALQLFYKDNDYSLLCVLPTSSETFSLEGVVQKLQDPKTFESIIDGLSYEEVNVYLPSIQTSTTTDLTKVFEAVNVTDVLSPQKSNLSGILKKFEPLYISAAIQKAVVIINELGSEAAAANAIVGRANAMPLPIAEPKVFEANRPYFYFILYKRNVLFGGAYFGS